MWIRARRTRRSVRGASLAAALGLCLCVAPGLAAEADVLAEAECDGFSLRFVELPFVHRSGASEERHLPETMGAGVAVVDVDGDGWHDLYFVQSGVFPPLPDSGPDGQPAPATADSTDVLLRNTGRTFEPWPVETPLASGYGQGVLALDADGDSDLDLFVTRFGTSRWLRNRADGTFEAGLQEADRLASPEWGSSAAAGDGDGDGDLDLYVTRYLEYDPAADLFCGDAETGVRDYCDPALFLGQRDAYLENLGNGVFREATDEAGLAVESPGKGLGVLFADLDGDGAPDLYVANDLTPNLLFRNRGDGTFEDLSLLSGAAVDRNGKPEAGMGVALGDWDADGDPDLAVTNFDVETNTLYRNQGDFFFEDVSASSGFGLPSFNSLGFGIVDGDLDLDGKPDVWVANGHIFEQPKRESVPYRQPDLLLRGLGSGRFEQVVCGVLTETARVGRGLASLDWDGDGDLDLVVTHNDDRAMLVDNRLHGSQDEEKGWVGVELLGAAENTQAVGAVVTLEAGGHRDRRYVLAGRSYQSSSDRRLLFGVPPGADPAALVLDVVWPRGQRTRLAQPPRGRYLRLHEPEPGGGR